MSRQIVRVALALAVRLSHRLLRDSRAVIPGPVEVGIDVGDADSDGVTVAERLTILVCAQFSQSHGSVTHIQLHAMAADSQTHGKAEGSAQPLGGLIHVALREDRNYGGAGDRSVRQHPASLRQIMPRQYTPGMEEFSDVARARDSYRVFLEAMNAGREIMRKAGVAAPPPVPDFDSVFQRLTPELRAELYAGLRGEPRSRVDTIRLWQPLLRRAFGA